MWPQLQSHSLHIGRRKLQSKYFMNNMELEKIHEEKDLGIHITDDLKWSTDSLVCLQEG